MKTNLKLAESCSRHLFKMIKFTTNGWGMALLFFDSLKLANLRNPMAYVRFMLCYNVNNCTDVELSERVNHLPFRQSGEVQNLTPNKEKKQQIEGKPQTN